MFGQDIAILSKFPDGLTFLRIILKALHAHGYVQLNVNVLKINSSVSFQSVKSSEGIWIETKMALE